MALTKEERQYLGTIYQKLDPLKPLEPGDPFYQSIYGAPGCDDPVDLLQQHIGWNPIDSMQMFSGFRGSGKTTELKRLKKNLEEQGYVVLYADALEYLNPSQEIEISDLLVVLAGAFSDAIEKEFKVDLAEESYWSRLKNYLTKTTVSLTEARSKTEIDTPLKEWFGGGKASIDLKFELRDTPSFRQKLQQFMEGRISELKNQTHKFIEDGVKIIRKKKGDETGIVFIFDSLEQLRGSRSNEQSVIRSVERLFADNMQMLALPYVHVVYTVPPWLQFAMPGLADIVMLPSVRQWYNDGVRTPYEPGSNSLRSLIHKRFGEEGCQKYFGTSVDGLYPLAERLIAVCGGHFRDLLLLFREALLRTKSLPVTEDVINLATTSFRSTFLPIAIDDAQWLDKIGKLRTTSLPSVKTEDVTRLTRFLDTHFVLYLTNGEEWYDIHPLIRDEVAAIVQRHGELKSSATPST